MAQREHKMAWTARSEADGALIEAAEAARRVVGAQGTTDAAAAALAAEATRRALASPRMAGKAFKRSSRLIGSAADKETSAVAALSMARDIPHMLLALDRSSKSRSSREAGSGRQ